MKPAGLIAVAGSTITVLALGGAWWQSSAADEALAAAAQAHTELGRLGGPEPALVTQAEEDAKRQADTLAEAAVLAHPLPEAYRATDLASAAKRVRDDLEALRLRADRLSISLPKALPYEGGLDSDPDVRAVQLAFLALIRQSVDHLLDAGVAQVSRLETSRAWSDPSGTFACFALDIAVDGSPASIQSLLMDLQRPTAGLGLAKVALESDKTGAIQRLQATITLLTTNQPEWKLQPEALPKAGPAKTTKGLGAGR